MRVISPYQGSQSWVKDSLAVTKNLKFHPALSSLQALLANGLLYHAVYCVATVRQIELAPNMQTDGLKREIRGNFRLRSFHHCP